MHSLISNYFSLNRLKAQFKNRHLSWLMFYDKPTRISAKSHIQRFVYIRESSIGEYSYIGHHSNIFRVTIGKFCSISRHVNIGLSSHPVNFLSTSPIFFSVNNATGHTWIDKDVYDDRPDPITLGNDVWIGMNVTIMGGVTIGNGAIIAAHSVVTKDVPAYGIVAGIPGKVIKYRFDEQMIAKLQKLRWWDLPEAFLKKHIKNLQQELTPQGLDEIMTAAESE